MVRSIEVILSFGYFDFFLFEECFEVRVKEGKGMVFFCDFLYYFLDDFSYCWFLNEFFVFIIMDKW